MKSTKEYKDIDLDAFKIDDLYYKLIDLAQNTEENRWGRFNTLLIINAIFLAAWASLLDGAKDSSYLRIALVLLCGTGIVLSVVWAFVGKGTSRYHLFYITHVKKIEEAFKEDAIMPRIMTDADRFARGEMKDTPTKILTWVPILFAVVFLALGIISIALPAF